MVKINQSMASAVFATLLLAGACSAQTFQRLGTCPTLGIVLIPSFKASGVLTEPRLRLPSKPVCEETTNVIAPAKIS